MEKFTAFIEEEGVAGDVGICTAADLGRDVVEAV